MLAVTGISRHGFFCYQTSVPLNKFVCKLYNVGGVPLHLNPLSFMVADFLLPPIGMIRWEKFDARCDGHCPSWLFAATQNLAFPPELCYNPIYQTS